MEFGLSRRVQVQPQFIGFDAVVPPTYVLAPGEVILACEGTILRLPRVLISNAEKPGIYCSMVSGYHEGKGSDVKS